MADKRISDLPAAAALTGAELMPVVQSGATVKAPIGGPIDKFLTTDALDPLFPTDSRTLVTRNLFIVAGEAIDAETPAVLYKIIGDGGVVLVEPQTSGLFSDPNPGSLRLGNAPAQGSELIADVITFWDQTGGGDTITISPDNTNTALILGSKVKVNGQIALNDQGTGASTGDPNQCLLYSDSGDLVFQRGDLSDYCQIEFGESLTMHSLAYGYAAGIAAQQTGGVNHLDISAGLAALGLRVNAGLAVFGAAPPAAKTTLNAAATDLATVIALTNQIRAMLIALGFAQ